MNYKIVKIGEYLEYYDEINKDCIFSDIEDLQGINSNKYFQECKSNKNDIDLSRYRICRNHTFAYNKATSRNGEKISIAYRTEGDCLISPSYITFKIKNPLIIIPEYLMLCFKNPIFDKYARFNSWGSATEFLNWEDFCNMEIKLPEYSEQQKIVEKAQILTNRIKILKNINEKLEEEIFIIYNNIFNSKIIYRDGIFNELGTIVSGATPSTANENFFVEEGIHWITPKDITSTNKKFISRGETDITEEAYKSCSTHLLPSGTVLLTSRAPVGEVAYAINDICTNQGFKSIVPNKGFSKEYIYSFIKSNRQLLENNSSGTTFLEISGGVLEKIEIQIPPQNLIEEYTKKIIPIQELQKQNEQEVDILNKLLIKLCNIG